MTQNTLNLDGHQLRDSGLKQVSDNNKEWMKECIEAIEDTFFIFQSFPDFTGEDIRKYCENSNLIPTNEHAWGALVRALLRRGLITKTGEYRTPKDRSSHARAIQVYRHA